MGWYLAPSLTVLRSEINARWPNRDRTSDGSIGDTAHQATKSDHNPNGRSSVNAIDVDKDGVNMDAIIAAFQRHPSAHYWIWQGQIADRDDGWRRRPYTGTNPHDKHGHFSIRQTTAAEQDRRPWGLLTTTQEGILMALSDAEQEEVLAAVRQMRKESEANTNRLLGLVALTPEITSSWSSVNPKGKDQLAIVPLLTGLRDRSAPTAEENANAILAALDGRTPEQIAAALEAVLGDQAAAVGRLLATSSL